MAEAFAKNVFINQERKSEVQRQLDTALILTVNYANWQSAPGTLHRISSLSNLIFTSKPKYGRLNLGLWIER
jgi:hypothetical protein